MRTENREKFIFFHLFFYFVAPAGFEPATSPPKGDVLPLHHGALDSFVPVVLAAHVVAASEPMPVCCASAIRPSRGCLFESCPRPADLGIIGLPDTLSALADWGDFARAPNPSPLRVAIVVV